MVHIHKITKKDRNKKKKKQGKTNVEKYDTYKICAALRIAKTNLQHDQVM